MKIIKVISTVVFFDSQPRVEVGSPRPAPKSVGQDGEGGNYKHQILSNEILQRCWKDAKTTYYEDIGDGIAWRLSGEVKNSVKKIAKL
jgi:hypothetical protein